LQYHAIADNPWKPHVTGCRTKEEKQGEYKKFPIERSYIHEIKFPALGAGILGFFCSFTQRISRLFFNATSSARLFHF
jgi:hypothetical protein